MKQKSVYNDDHDHDVVQALIHIYFDLLISMMY